MAVGDIVNVGLDSATSYQPAAGIELVVLVQFNAEVAGQRGMTNGVLTVYNVISGNAVSSGPTLLGSKFGITNTWYYFINTADVGSGFAAIQIK